MDVYRCSEGLLFRCFAFSGATFWHESLKRHNLARNALLENERVIALQYYFYNLVTCGIQLTRGVNSVCLVNFGPMQETSSSAFTFSAVSRSSQSHMVSFVICLTVQGAAGKVWR